MADQGTPTIPPPVWLRRWWARWVFLRTGSRRRFRGSGHRVELHDALLDRCTIELFGANNTLEILPGARLWNVTLRLVGSNLHCRIGAHSRLHGGVYVLEDQSSRLEIGAGSTLYAPVCVVNEGGTIRIGVDCMVANATDLRNSDGHSILDATTRERLNPASDITLADHVWIGACCQILKGVTIGTRAIVAARSVVTKDVASGTLVAGVPARVIRENVSWDERRL